MKKRYIKASVISLLALSLPFVAIFLLTHQQRNSQLVGGWESDGTVAYTWWFYANGRGRVEPENYVIGWHIRSGQLRIESLGVVREYEYLIMDDIRLILTHLDHTGTIHNRTYTRVR